MVRVSEGSKIIGHKEIVDKLADYNEKYFEQPLPDTTNGAPKRAMNIHHNIGQSPRILLQKITIDEMYRQWTRFES